MKRKQFTFYYSFYDVISCIESREARAEAYDVLCRYALLGEKPDFTDMSLGAKMAVKAFMPTLDAARKKAQSGAMGGSKPKANGKQTASKNEDKAEEKIKNQKEHKCEAAFARFWAQAAANFFSIGMLLSRSSSIVQCAFRNYKTFVWRRQKSTNDGHISCNNCHSSGQLSDFDCKAAVLCYILCV